MTLGEKIKNKRLERDMYQDELARLSGVSKPMISYVERDLKTPSLKTLRKIATALSCSLDELDDDAS